MREENTECDQRTQTDMNVCTRDESSRSYGETEEKEEEGKENLHFHLECIIHNFNCQAFARLHTVRGTPDSCVIYHNDDNAAIRYIN